MEETFLRAARNTECKSVTGRAYANIKRFAIKKKEAPRRPSNSRQGSHDEAASDDSNLLPTPSCLVQAFADEGVVLELSQCRCEALCGPLGSTARRATEAAPTEAAQTIHRSALRDPMKRNALAVLILSGCTFALRDFFHSDCSTVEEFLSEVNVGGDSRSSDTGSRGDEDRVERGLRDRLFRPLLSSPAWSGETVESIAAKFIDSVRAKAWLVRIRQFSISGELITISSARKHNMPFVEERPAFQGRPNRRYIRFKIADGYALSDQLQGRTLFRKELKGSTLCQEAHDEVRMLSIINGMDHPSITRMLFAFEEQDPLNQRISIVYRFNEFDLDRGILNRPVQESAQILSRFDNAMQPPVPLEGILEHGLWKAMLGIVDAVKSLHEFHHPDIRPDQGDVIHVEHFDIKPANILIEIRNQRSAKLLLADFGRARLDAHPASQTTGQADAPATYDYAPPEAYPIEGSSTAEIIMRRSYDVWSLGCVLLEVLVYLQTGDAVGFRNARQHESRENHEDAAFWYRDQSHIPHLRSATEKNLRALERSPQSNVERVARCIRHMLSPDEAQRRQWPITRCLAAFHAFKMPSWNDMISTSKRALLDPELADMTTRCWRRNFQQWLPCNLFYFRDRTPSDADEAMLVVERSGVPWNESRLIKDEKIALLPFFESRSLLSTSQSTSGTLNIAFDRLHGEMLFHFQSVVEYLKFFAVLSHQQVALGSSRAGLDIRCQACELHIRRTPLPSRIESMGDSRVQLWSTYDKRGYNQRFETQQGQLQPSGTGSYSSQRRSIAVAGNTRSLPAAQNSRFKLALFTLTSKNDSRAANTGMRAVIVELDRENIQLDSRAGDSRKISFSRAGEHASFPVAVLEPSVQVASPSGPDEQYPGIPMSPEQLNELIRESRTRLKRLEIEFPERSAHRTNLMALLEYYRVF